MVKKLKFVINDQGEVSISVEGAQGQECEALSAPFEAALGRVEKKEFKDSYFQTEETATNVENSNG